MDVSLPTRERGLKLNITDLTIREQMSLPTRERGLKYIRPVRSRRHARVAPHAGAWIEILISIYFRTASRTSLPTRERGLKFFLLGLCRRFARVAPHAGAWIEI